MSTVSHDFWHNIFKKQSTLLFTVNIHALSPQLAGQIASLVGREGLRGTSVEVKMERRHSLDSSNALTLNAATRESLGLRITWRGLLTPAVALLSLPPHASLRVRVREFAFLECFPAMFLLPGTLVSDSLLNGHGE